MFKCKNGFIDDTDKRHNFGDRINYIQYHKLTSQQQRNYERVVEEDKKPIEAKEEVIKI